MKNWLNNYSTVLPRGKDKQHRFGDKLCYLISFAQAQIYGSLLLLLAVCWRYKKRQIYNISFFGDKVFLDKCQHFSRKLFHEYIRWN